MAATFVIEGDLTREGLADARDEIDALLEQLPGPAGIVNGDALLKRKIEALNERMGEATWDFIVGCAEAFQKDDELTFDDLAEFFGEDVAKVKSWHRSASKSINRVNDTYGGPAVLESRWDGSRQHYRMPVETRNAILEFENES